MVSALLLAGLAGCSSVTSGHGSATSAGASLSQPDFPSTSPTTPGPSTATFPSTTPTPPPSPSPGPQTRAQRAAQLRAQTNGEDTVLVRVPSGYQAASYDQSGNISFWSEAASDTTWQLIGHSRYPTVSQLGPPQASARGTLLRNMSDATYIVRGVFTGDGSGNAVAFTNGPRGWGAIKAEPNGNIGPSGRPVGANLIGLSYDFGFRNGYLVTQDCSLDRPISDCDQYPITKLWVWTGQDFTRV